MKKYFMRTLVLILLACSSDDKSSSKGNPNNEGASDPNILLIIADDMGLDATPEYNIGIQKPVMNTLQGFIDNGIRFTNLWSNPTCTPTRSTILTGNYGFRTNMTKVGDELSATETSLQSYIETQTGSKYSQAVIGKWHLSSDESHPTQMGVTHYAGLLKGAPQAYDNWNFTENGNTTTSNEYITSKFTDLAIDWLGVQTKPWFLWLAYTAPHTPFHLPPNELHTQGVLPNDDVSIAANPLPYYFAMLEAMDAEMGRLLASLSKETLDNTVIIFIGDNGSPNQVAQDYNSTRVKGTVYQGGVNVPMIVTGKNVDRVNEVEEALINTTDLFATIADIAGTGITNINDSVSFKNVLETSQKIRDYAYTEIGNDTGGSDYTIRNTTHKYILLDNGSERLYNLIDSPLETINLMNVNRLPLSNDDAIIKDELINELDRLRN